MFDHLRQSLDDLLARATKPEERRAILSRMRDTLTTAKLGLDDLRAGLERSRQRLESERDELETVQRRKRLAEGIGDSETVRLAAQYEQLHAERLQVLTRKVAAQEEELAIAEREVAQMMTELRAVASGATPPSGERDVRTALDELESELGGNSASAEELDSIARSRSRAEREAEAARKLEELKRRMGK